MKLFDKRKNYKLELTYIFEGININRKLKTVSFDMSHENNVDTSTNNNPKRYKYKGYDIISIFERKENENKNDGNLLIYALKNINGWRFENESGIYALLKQFIKITKTIKDSYDTIIMIPSSNPLNEKILFKLEKLIEHKYVIKDIFSKLEASEVFECLDTPNMPNHIYSRLEKEFDVMIKNDNKFQFKLISKDLRPYVQKIYKDVSDVNRELDYADMINDKNILILDDTIASGSTLSVFCRNIIDIYSPKSLTVITLFSALLKKG